ncbi:MAG: TlyA family rRNA (cytidine-2'-O)-methyltransferase [Bdellovibrio sp.]
MKEKMRADLAMVEVGLCPTRSQAAQLINQEVVFCGQERVRKPSQNVNPADLRIIKENMYVSRGGDKLEGALKKLNIDLVENFTVADVGASTGGFTDCLLKKGASKVYCIDVGHDQLNPMIKADPRVINFEGVNIRHGIDLPEKVDLVVSDLSFISLKLVLKEMFDLLKPDGQLLTLVKPQFEVGKNGVDGHGIVKSEELRRESLIKLVEFYQENNWPINGICDSPILGKDGNKEYFFWTQLQNKKTVGLEQLWK